MLLLIKKIITPCIRHVKLSIFQVKWRKLNKHNFTTVNNIFKINKVIIGKKTYGALNILSYNNNFNNQLIIGNFCSIAEDVLFILDGEHPYDGLSTYPFKVNICKNKFEALSKGSIKIYDDVWIGQRVIILSGVTLGQGCIIAAGSIVTKDVPPYSIVGGNPAKIIKYRFNQNIIDKLKEFDFEKIEENNIKSNISLLYNKLTNDNIDEILNKFS